MKKFEDAIVGDAEVIDYSKDVVKADDFMVNVIGKLIAKIEAGKGIVEEFTPAVLKEKPFDSIFYTIDDREDVEAYREILDEANISIDEILDGHEEVEIELANCNDSRPTMLAADEQGVVHYDSFFHSALCEIGGNAYRLGLREDSNFFLIKVLHEGEHYYELYLSDSREFCPIIEEQDYILLNETTPLCNSNTEEMQVLLDKLYNSFYQRIHQPKITEGLKNRLEILLA